MSLSINFQYPQLVPRQVVTYDGLNALFAGITIDLNGSIGSATIADGSITLPKIQTGIFTADTPGRAPFINGWLNLALVGTGIFTATTAGRAPFLTGIWTAAYLDDSTQKQLQNYAAGTQTSTVYAVTLSPAPTAYTVGMLVRFKADTANAGAVDINVNAIGAKNIFKQVGSELAANDIVANQIVELLYDGTNFQMQVPKVVPGIVATARNLIAKNNVSTPLSQADITADEILLKDSTGLGFVATAVSVTAAITASGLNGLDTGSEAANTWYYLWLIYNGTTVGSLLSISSTAPTLPSGYTFKALIGRVRNDGSSNFVTFYQQDRTIWFAKINVFSGNGSLTYVTVNPATVLSPLAKAAIGYAGLNNNNGGWIAIAGNSSDVGKTDLVLSSSGGFADDSLFSSGHFEVPLITAQTFSHKEDNATRAYSIYLSGERI